MNAKTKGLGRGLSAIFESEKVSVPVPEKQTVSLMEEVAISAIKPNPNQPRTRFDEDALGELADSIKTLGVIQPVTLNRDKDGTYTIISGERRWRASRMAGLDSMPAYVREVDDQGMHEMALVENIQRQDLNPMEVAMSLQRLVDECGLTQDMLSERVGKKRSTVANYMRLLKLPAEVQSAVRDEYISMGHAKAIAAVPEERQVSLLRKTVTRGLSVRQLEEMARKAAGKVRQVGESADEEDYPEIYSRLVEHLEKFFSQDISIRKSKKGGGRIVIDFADDTDIATFIERFEKAVES